MLFGGDAKATGRTLQSFPIASSSSIIATSASSEIAQNTDKAAEAFLTKGLEKYERQGYRGAIEDYDQAIQLKPDFASAYNNRGIVRSELGDKNGEIEDYDQAIRLKPNNANAYTNRGIARRALGNKNGAIADLQKAAELYPTDSPQRQRVLDQLKKLQQ